MVRTTRILVAGGLLVAVLALPGTALGAIKITAINFDPPGSDTGSNSHLNKEYVVIKTQATRLVSYDGGSSSTRAGFTPTVSHASSCAPIAR